jgi:K+-sensing histidine kinase KdpD
MATRTRSELLRNDLAARAKALRPAAVAIHHRQPAEELSRLLAHDLKTSLASIAMNLDFAIAELGPSAVGAVAPALEDCRQANARAIRIVSDMADAAHLAAGGYRPKLVEVRPGQLIEKVVAEASSEAALRAIEMVVETDETRVFADADLLSRVIDRLLGRALRQARAGSRLDITQKDCALSIRAGVGAGGAAELTAPSLALYFAEVAMIALGGRAWVESPEAEVLVCRVRLPG